MTDAWGREVLAAADDETAAELDERAEEEAKLEERGSEEDGGTLLEAAAETVLELRVVELVRPLTMLLTPPMSGLPVVEAPGAAGFASLGSAGNCRACKPASTARLAAWRCATMRASAGCSVARQSKASRPSAAAVVPWALDVIERGMLLAVSMCK